MNKEELLKQLEEAKKQIAKLQNDMDKMQNAVDTIKNKDNNSLPEFWLPKRDERYYFIDAGDFDYPCGPLATEWDADPIDFINVMLNNVFRTEEECEIEIKLLRLFAEIKEKALQEDELVSKNKVFDTHTNKYFISYDYSNNKLSDSVFTALYRQGIIPNCYFKTPEFAKKIIKEYGECIKMLLNKKYGGK